MTFSLNYKEVIDAQQSFENWKSSKTEDNRLKMPSETSSNKQSRTQSQSHNLSMNSPVFQKENCIESTGKVRKRQVNFAQEPSFE
jgi:hypothetical protein